MRIIRKFDGLLGALVLGGLLSLTWKAVPYLVGAVLVLR